MQGILNGLYVHVPFCSAICPYCDFAVTTAGAERRAAFVDRVAEEARLWGERRFPGGAFDTVYLGGGTPSILAPQQLATLLAALRLELAIAPDAWITLEANPEDVSAGAVEAWRDLGVGTLSLGVQSFDDPSLRFLGRRHVGREARRAVEVALEAGFPTVSVDLIYGLPGHDGPDGARWRRDLDTVAALAPPHVSCYQLTVHERTAFGVRRDRGTLRELPETRQADLFRLTHERLGELGWEGYEVSNFARTPSDRSRHNSKYWAHVPYLGLGPSAHSFDGATRWWNHRGLADWSAALETGRDPVAGRDPITAAERALEHLMLGLRTRSGVDLSLLRGLGVDLERHSLLPQLLADDLLRREGDRLVPTLSGWAVADGLAAALAPEPRAAAAPAGVVS